MTTSNICQLYKITNLISGKAYVGVSKNIKKRFSVHCGNHNGKPTYINSAICKYGKDNFEFKILLTGTIDYCYGIEAKAIVAFDTLTPNGYNIAGGGEGARAGACGINNSMYGRKHTEISLEKMRIAQGKTPNWMKGKQHSAEVRAKISLSNLGRKHTQVTKDKMSVSRSGSKNPQYGLTGEKSTAWGKKHTQESLNKMTISKIGANNPMYGMSGSFSPTSKKCTAISPDGIIYHADSLIDLYTEIGMSRSTASKLITNVRKSRKGWVLKYD